LDGGQGLLIGCDRINRFAQSGLARPGLCQKKRRQAEAQQKGVEFVHDDGF
jgi:hypothetical protein